MVETPPADAGDTGATPDPGTEEQPCPCTRDPPPQAAREAATARSMCRLQREQPLHRQREKLLGLGARDPAPQAARAAAAVRSLCRLQREQPLIAAAGGKPCSSEDQHSQNQTNDFYRGTGLEMVKYSGR